MTDLVPGQRVVVELAPSVRDVVGLPPAMTTAQVVEPAPGYGEGMWWLDVELPTGDRMRQLYQAAEVAGQWVGPSRPAADDGGPNPAASAVVRVAVYPVGIPGHVVYGITAPAGHPVQDLTEAEAIRILRAAADQLEANPGSGVGLHREELP